MTNILWNSTTDGIDEWGAKAAAEYVWRNRKDYTRIGDVVADALEEPYRRMMYHADIGTRVHHLVEHPEDEGDECREVQRSMNAWDDFINDKDVKIRQFEIMMAGLTGEDDEIGAGGTLDNVAEIPEAGFGLLEVKTSRVLHDTHAFQAAAYAHLWEFMGGQTLDFVWLLRLGKYDGLYEIEEVNRPLCFKGFRAAQTLFDIRGSEHIWLDHVEAVGTTRR